MTTKISFDFEEFQKIVVDAAINKIKIINKERNNKESDIFLKEIEVEILRLLENDKLNILKDLSLSLCSLSLCSVYIERAVAFYKFKIEIESENKKGAKGSKLKLPII